MSARARFRVVVFSSLMLRVGTVGRVIDTIQFDLSKVAPDGSHPTSFTPPFGLGSGSQEGIAGGLNGTATGGSTVPVVASVMATLPNVQISASVSGTGLVSGANALPYTQIVASSDSTSLPAPEIPASGSGTAQTVSGCDTPCTGSVYRSATWTFRYANTVVPSDAGTYTGQIAYTATTP